METVGREGFLEITKKAFSLSEDKAENGVIRDRLLSGGKVTGTNLCVMIYAMVIASVGLNTGSTAVIIGAMLISPLMGSILAIAYGCVSVDLSLVKKLATALMPPLCTCGYSIANRNLQMLGGAVYLFAVNACFIFLASSVILSAMRIPKVRELRQEEWIFLKKG